MTFSEALLQPTTGTEQFVSTLLQGPFYFPTSLDRSDTSFVSCPQPWTPGDSTSAGHSLRPTAFGYS